VFYLARSKLADRFQVASDQLVALREADSKTRELLSVATQKYTRMIEVYRQEKSQHAEEVASLREGVESELLAMKVCWCFFGCCFTCVRLEITQRM
jgi:predicted  nucleic acid-binding Zn-ribbon protein